MNEPVTRHNFAHRLRGAARRWKTPVRNLLLRMFAADLRSLAALRIAMGVLLLFDLASRASSLRLMYTDEGIMPRDNALNALSPWSWSIGFMNGSVGFQRLVFAVTACAAISLILGYRTRVVTVLVWVLVSSLHVRNPMILSGGDLLLRMLLFWSMFVPLGAVWSIDAWRQRPSKAISMRFLSVGSMAIFLQIAFMYWFTAALKTGPEWRDDGSALFYVLRRPLYTTWIGESLQDYTLLLQTLSYGTMVIEVVAPILLFFPIWNTRARLIGIGSLLGLQLGIMFTMSIGLFPFVSSSCLLVLLPTAFWDTVEPRVRAVVGHRLPAFARFRESLAHATPGLQGTLPLRLQTTAQPDVFQSTVPRGTERPDSGADASRVSGDVPDASPSMLRTPRIVNAVVACLLAFVLAWNMTTVTAFDMPRVSQQVAYSLNIQQNWVMFAPSPPRFNTRYVLRGTLQNGQEVEMLLPVLQGNLDTIVPFTWEPPSDLGPGYYPDMRWRLYLARLGSATREQRYTFANYVCRTWNGHYEGDMQVVSLVYVYVIDDILPDGTRSPERTSGYGPYSCI